MKSSQRDRSVPRHLARVDNRKPFGAGLDGSAVDLLAILVMPEHRSAANRQGLISRRVLDQYPLGVESCLNLGDRQDFVHRQLSFEKLYKRKRSARVRRS